MSNFAQFWAEQFVDDSNNPFAGCLVYHYEAGTTSTKNTYRDRAKTTVSQQPEQGDSLGVVWFYGDGLYRLRVTTADNVLLYDWDNVDISPPSVSLDVANCEVGMVPVYAGPDNAFACDFLDLAFVSGCLPIANCGTGTDDIPTNGSLLIGNLTGGYTVAQLTAGAGIEIVNGDGSIEVGIANDEGAQSQPFGSIGQISTATGTTVTLNATIVTVRHPTDGTSFSLDSPVGVSASTSVAGLGGRDQTAAFSAESWIHAYWLYRPSDNEADPIVAADLKAVLSLNTPPTGPTLDSGPLMGLSYTHWSYAGTFRFDSSSAFIDARVAGNMLFYNLRKEVLSEGTASSETSVDLSGFVPPNALAVQLLGLFYNANNSAFTHPHAMISPYTGMAKESSFSFLTSGDDPEGDTQSFLCPNVSQKLYYINNSDNGKQKKLHIYVQGYSLPNNGA